MNYQKKEVSAMLDKVKRNCGIEETDGRAGHTAR